MLIQANLETPCTVLDYPTRERFEEELRTRSYDVIGISSIPTNLMKVRRMCRMIRKLQPDATIVVGGHIANVPDLNRWCDLDHAVRGEGVRWMRGFLGEDGRMPEVVAEHECADAKRLGGIGSGHERGDRPQSGAEVIGDGDRRVPEVLGSPGVVAPSLGVGGTG